MAIRRQYLAGRKFGRLTVIKEMPTLSEYRHRWLCQCECGGEKITIGKSLLNGDTQSCGCLHTESVIKHRTTHGHSKTPEWDVWVSMRGRCSIPSVTGYEFYGARGISVAPEWSDFETFYKDMGPRPSPFTQ